MSTNAELYEQDFYAWTQATAALVQAGKWHEIDPGGLTEELRDLGSNIIHALHSPLYQLPRHLLQWQYQAQRRMESVRMDNDKLSSARQHGAVAVPARRGNGRCTPGGSTSTRTTGWMPAHAPGPGISPLQPRPAAAAHVQRIGTPYSAKRGSWVT